MIRADQVFSTDPISVRPTSEARPVSGRPFSLMCVGAKNMGSVSWQKNGHAITTSENVHLSSDGLTLAFSRLEQADSGLYECLVSEGGEPLRSLGHNMTVICEYERCMSKCIDRKIAVLIQPITSFASLPSAFIFYRWPC